MLVRLQTHLNSFTIHALILSHVRYRQSHGRGRSGSFGGGEVMDDRLRQQQITH
jgi:hypothetical protein